MHRIPERVHVELQLVCFLLEKLLFVLELGEYLQIGLEELEHIATRAQIDEAVAVVFELILAHVEVIGIQVFYVSYYRVLEMRI